MAGTIDGYHCCTRRCHCQQTLIATCNWHMQVLLQYRCFAAEQPEHCPASAAGNSTSRPIIICTDGRLCSIESTTGSTAQLGLAVETLGDPPLRPGGWRGMLCCCNASTECFGIGFTWRGPYDKLALQLLCAQCCCSSNRGKSRMQYRTNRQG